MNWIKGHSGNKLHECADRHAARAAFRPINGPSRKPNESNYPYALYFYESLITGMSESMSNSVSRDPPPKVERHGVPRRASKTSHEH